MKAGCDPSTPNVSGVTCLHLAAMFGLVYICDDLIKAGCDFEPRADDSFKMRGGDNRSGEIPVLFDKQGDLYDSPGFCMGSNITPLYLAARAGYADVVRRLIKAGCDINITKDFSYHTGIVPVHSSSALGHYEATKALLAAGCDINIAASDGGTALHCAAEFGHDDILTLLLDYDYKDQTINLNAGIHNVFICLNIFCNKRTEC